MPKPLFARVCYPCYLIVARLTIGYGDAHEPDRSGLNSPYGLLVLPIAVMQDKLQPTVPNAIPWSY